MYITSVQALIVGIGFLIVNLLIMKIANSITEPAARAAWLVQEEYEGRIFWLMLGWSVSLAGTVISLLVATSLAISMLLASIALVTPFASTAARNATGVMPRPMTWGSQEVRSINWATTSLLALFVGVIDGISSDNPWMIFGLPLICGAWFLLIYGVSRKFRSPAPS